MRDWVSVDSVLPSDGSDATLVGRVWLPGEAGGPTPCAVRGEMLVDLTAIAPTMSLLLDTPDIAGRIAAAPALPQIGRLDTVLANGIEGERDGSLPHLLAPNDLQAIKASGVTFVESLLERVIEEQARGDPAKAEAIRARIQDIIGEDLSEVNPGSEDAARIKEVLIAEGAWSQYLEVGIGPDAEIFTKSQPMSAVGHAADVGIHPISTWNNPEPEIVLAVNARGDIVGATLGNDVNLRDVEGRSALLLGKAKDNNASCAVGPFIRVFDHSYGLDDVRGADLTLIVEGIDGYRLEGASSMSRISRDPQNLVEQAIGPNHQYPDGLVLFLGTMFAPIEDRDESGGGFTHKLGDIVVITTPKLGSLVNRVKRSDEVAPWTFGTGALMQNLARRGLL